jgi:hypothetical protein
MRRFFNLIPVLLLILGCETDDQPAPPIDEDFSDYRKIKEIRTISSFSGFPFERSVQKFEYKEDKPYQTTYTIDSTFGMIYQFEYNNQNKIQTIYQLNSEEINPETGQPFQAGTDISGSDSLFNITTYTYENDNLVEISKVDNRNTLIYHVQNENEKIVWIDIETIPYNSDVIFDAITFKYNSNENIYEISRSNEDGSTILEFQFDNNTNPFYAYYKNFGILNIQAEGLRDGFASFISPNNIINNWSETSYDNRGYPVKLEVNDFANYRKIVELIYK